MFKKTNPPATLARGNVGKRNLMALQM